MESFLVERSSSIIIRGITSRIEPVEIGIP